MIAGHIGAAAAAKSLDHRIPFWVLLVASFLIDILFVVLWVFGVERSEPLPGTDGGYGNLMLHVDWSHAFFTAIVLSFVALIFAARSWGGRGALIVSGLVFSHWFLDLIVHRNYLPIMPGNAGGAMPRVGLGLWDVPVAAAIFEALLVIGGAYMWYRSRPQPAPGGESPRAQRITRAAAAALAGGLLVLVIDFTL
jgi:hypothetical protein